MESSVRFKPRFKRGDKIKMNYDGEIQTFTIKEINQLKDDKNKLIFTYKFEEGGSLYGPTVDNMAWLAKTETIPNPPSYYREFPDFPPISRKKSPKSPKSRKSKKRSPLPPIKGGLRRSRRRKNRR